MWKQLDNYDWREAFGYAGEPEQYGFDLPQPVVGEEKGKVSLDPISREDVAYIYWMDNGENDGAPWIGVFRIKDGRYLFLEAGCDYTGWDCQAYGQAWVSNSLERLIQFGMSEDNRQRLGIDLGELEEHLAVFSSLEGKGEK